MATTNRKTSTLSSKRTTPAEKTGRTQFTLIISECEHSGDVEHTLNEIRAFDGGLQVWEIVSSGGVGYETGVAAVEVQDLDIAKFKMACDYCGSVQSCQRGNSYTATVDRLEAEHMIDLEDQDDQDEDGDDY